MEFNKTEYNDLFFKKVSVAYKRLLPFYNAIEHRFIFNQYEYLDNKRYIHEMINKYCLSLIQDEEFGVWIAEDENYNMIIYGCASCTQI